MIEGSDYGNVVTTIQNPTNALRELANMSRSRGEPLFIIADKKTPLEFSLSGTNFLSVTDQAELPYSILRHIPWNSYTRKMLGYLEAAKSKCKFIRETDDDNFPHPSYFLDFQKNYEVRLPQVSGDWINPYIYFSDQYIWPRGYPIELIENDREMHGKSSQNFTYTSVSKIGVIQGLANGAPDVDALYRLIYSNSGEFKFNEQDPLLIPNGTFAPFNSQVTTWNIELLPLMYLPHTCTFRMTDIWRSFIATYLMHYNDYNILFTSASAFQDRNEHNLLRDFSDEVPGYIGNSRLISELKSVRISGGPLNLGRDLRNVYQHLVSQGFFESKELMSLDSWLSDCEL